MNIRKLLLSLLTVTAAATASAVHPGDIPKDSIPPQKPVIVILPLPPIITPGNGRPLAPSRQNITCEYDAGNLNFRFAIPEGKCFMILTDSNRAEKIEQYFDSACEMPIYVGPLTNGYIKLCTSQGHVYGGPYSIYE